MKSWAFTHQASGSRRYPDLPNRPASGTVGDVAGLRGGSCWTLLRFAYWPAYSRAGQGPHSPHLVMRKRYFASGVEPYMKPPGSQETVKFATASFKLLNMTVTRTGSV